MGYLQGNNIHVDKHLTNVAINYRPQNLGYGADIFPVVRVAKQTDMIKTYTQADLFRQDSTLRAPGTEANKISFQVNSSNYHCKNYAIRSDITIEDLRNADPAFVRDMEGGRVMFLMDKLMLDWDIRVASNVTSTSNVGTSANVASSWTDNTNSDPFADINAMIDNVENITGYRPNRMVVGGNSWREMRRNDKIIDKASATGLTGADQNASISQVQELFEMEKVVVARTYYNTAEEGITQSLSRAFGDHVLVYYAPMQHTIERPSYGYSFRWVAPGLDNMTVRRIPFNNETQIEGLSIGYYQDEKVTVTTLGALVANTNSSQ